MVSLDSTFIIDLLRGVPAAVERAERLDREATPRFVTAPAASEVLIGSTFYGKKELEKSLRLLSALPLLEFDLEACEEAGRIGARLLELGEPLSTSDLFIASITRRHGETLLTRDRDFTRVPGLTVETY